MKISQPRYDRRRFGDPDRPDESFIVQTWMEEPVRSNGLRREYSIRDDGFETINFVRLKTPTRTETTCHKNHPG